ncbi:MAG: hypothetical protein R3C49_14780 [Planctomycetaceae bacterium]
MRERLSKLKRIISRLRGSGEAAVAVPYEIKCDCGASVTGMRRISWIEAECGNCCESLFVLPANVYPSTPSVPSQVLGGSFSERLKAVIQELKPEKTVTDKTAAPEPPVIRQPQSVPVRRWSLPRPDIAGILKRTFTPFRMLMLAVLLVTGLTGRYLLHQRAFEQAQQVWLEATDRIQLLLKDENFPDLSSELKDVTDAGIVLGKQHDPEWRRLNNLRLETEARNSISAGDLLSAFHKGYDGQGHLTDQAADLVTFACRTGTFFFDSQLQPVKDASGEFLIEFPASPGTHRVLLTVAQPSLQALLDESGDGRCLFAARIQSVESPASDDSGEWKLHIDPSSFVLLTSQQLAESIGLSADLDESVPALLERQLAFVENHDWGNGE